MVTEDEAEAEHATDDEAAAAAHVTGSEHHRVCGVCGRVLEHYEDFEVPENSHWRHSVMDQTLDHPAIPVDLSINVQMRCDFCSTDMHLLDGWVVPADTFVIVGPNRSEGNWKACDICKNYVTHKNWDGLVKRVLNIMRTAQVMTPETRKAVGPELRRMYGLLDKAMTGKPYRVAGHRQP